MQEIMVQDVYKVVPRVYMGKVPKHICMDVHNILNSQERNYTCVYIQSTAYVYTPYALHLHDSRSEI